MVNDNYGIKEVEQEMEELNRKIKKVWSYGDNIGKIGLIIAIIGFVVFFLKIIPEEQNLIRTLVLVISIFSLIIAIAGVIYFAGPVVKMKEEYILMYKEKFVLAVLKEQFDNVVYNWKKGYTKEEIRQKAFVEDGSIFKSEDYLEAEYNGVKFTRADLIIVHQTKEKTKNIFKGRVYEFDFNKNIPVSLRIKENNFSYAIIPANLENAIVKTENVEFNEKFTVRSVDDESVFYVLTPQMMEYIMKLSKKFRSLYIIIEGSKMLLAVKTGDDSFEIDQKDVVNFEEEKEKIIGELNEIKLIVDELKLADKRFLEINTDNKYSNPLMDKLNGDVVEKSMDEMLMGDIG